MVDGENFIRLFRFLMILFFQASDDINCIFIMFYIDLHVRQMATMLMFLSSTMSSVRHKDKTNSMAKVLSHWCRTLLKERMAPSFSLDHRNLERLTLCTAK